MAGMKDETAHAAPSPDPVGSALLVQILAQQKLMMDEIMAMKSRKKNRKRKRMDSDEEAEDTNSDTEGQKEEEGPRQHQKHK